MKRLLAGGEGEGERPTSTSFPLPPSPQLTNLFIHNFYLYGVSHVVYERLCGTGIIVSYIRACDTSTFITWNLLYMPLCTKGCSRSELTAILREGYLLVTSNLFTRGYKYPFPK